MSETDARRVGRLVQDYAHALRQRAGAEPPADLDADICERVEMLGLDADRLLGVPPGVVMATLEAMEHEAHREDAGAKRSADKVRARERAR